MSRRRASPFQTIDLATLDGVSGGRIIPQKGMDPTMIQGIQELAKAVAAITQSMDAQKQQSSAQMMQMMQQMMAKRGGG
ncbi:MAG: hypothetical protein KF773_32965 [Deltaproteobacteria bacterium]|nr:hypothetical protein [Deltaproteobacteria bacterium]MCW5801076.1 hypothetical protein [Deltaproteobacteria bacterium]